ncbi:hypothetical protein ACFL1X_11750 [Candidatus Hydrogenedentota bacterium]
MANEIRLENDRLDLHFEGREGRLLSLQDKETGIRYEFSDNGVTVTADNWRIDCTEGTIVSLESTSECITAVFRSQDCEVTVRHSLLPGRKFFEKTISITPERDSTLLEVVSGDYSISPSFEDTLSYSALWSCPTCVFLRGADAGLFAGIENPIFKSDAEVNRLRLSFQPAYRICAGEKYVAEDLFMGTYEMTHKYSTKELPDEFGWYVDRFDNFADLISYDVLDWGEIIAMQEFIEHYMPPRFTHFARMCDGWFAQFACLENDDGHPEDVERMKLLIDNLLELGVTTTSITSLPVENVPPRDSSVGWRFNRNTEKVLEYGKSRGMSLGVYLGNASPFCLSGNSSELIHCPDHPEWRKEIRDDEPQFTEVARWITGDTTECYGADEFVDWMVECQANTIRHYDLGWWCWDGMIGNRRPCHASNHRHLPGDSFYAEFRGRTEMIRRLRETFPDLWLNMYWGVKPYGPWGLRDVDTHENYFEIAVWDKHEFDEAIAHNGRLQCFWNATSRFMPPHKNYVAVSHLTPGGGVYRPKYEDSTNWVREENVFEHGEYWDEYGWKQSLLSAIGTSSSAFIQTFPNDFSAPLSSDIVEFYRKWWAWADENIEYLQKGRPLFGPPRLGHIDGQAHIIGDHGFIFLYNMNHKRLGGLIPLGPEIGLDGEVEYVLQEMYPEEGRLLAVDGKGVFKRGDEIPVFVPPCDCVVYELRRYDPVRDFLFGVNGQLSYQDSSMSITEVSGPIGETREVVVREIKDVESMCINNVGIPFEREAEFMTAAIRFDEEAFPEELMEWDKKAGLMTCRFVLPAEMESAFEIQRARPRPSGLPVLWWADAGRFIIALSYKHIVTIQDKLVCTFNGKAVDKIHDRGFAFFLDLDGLADFGSENILTLKHESLMKEQLYAARIINVPQRFTSSVSGGEKLSMVPRDKLTPAFADAHDINELKQRVKFAEEVIARYGKIPKPNERKKERKEIEDFD